MHLTNPRRNSKAMDEEEKNAPITYSFTDNVIKKGVFLNNPTRNWIEAALSTAFVLWVINSIHFTGIVRLIASLTFGGATFFFMLKGIKNRSVTEILIAEIKFRRGRRKLHLRGPEYKRQKKDFSSMEGGNESIAQRYWKEWRQKLLDFAKENTQE